MEKEEDGIKESEFHSKVYPSKTHRDKSDMHVCLINKLTQVNIIIKKNKQHFYRVKRARLLSISINSETILPCATAELATENLTFFDPSGI